MEYLLTYRDSTSSLITFLFCAHFLNFHHLLLLAYFGAYFINFKCLNKSSLFKNVIPLKKDVIKREGQRVGLEKTMSDHPGSKWL